MGGSKIHVCIAGARNDTAEIVKVRRLPSNPAMDSDEAQHVLVECLQELRFEPYTMLSGDMAGFRRSVSKLHSAWRAHGFRSMAVVGDVLDKV
jgi:hypothetical protein